MRKILFLLLITLKGHGAESVEFADKVIQEHGLSGASAEKLKNILTQDSEITRNIGTEDPTAIEGPHNSWHPASREKCIEKVLKTKLISHNPVFENICKAKWMSPIPNEAGDPIEKAKVCIDQFEFPDIPCEYPVVWSRPALAQKICESMGKRVCRSHEWEGACAGGIDPNNPYHMELGSKEAQRKAHNDKRENIWTFQWQNDLKEKKDSRILCGVFHADDPEISSPMRENPTKYYTQDGKSPQCQRSGSDYSSCGTNTWPSGFKYLCRSQNDVFDMHGNVAEVVNLPTKSSSLKIGADTDMTERKGSFFVYRPYYPDDCRVRQPYEHFESYKTGQESYYQEGFRCCKDI